MVWVRWSDTTLLTQAQWLVISLQISWTHFRLSTSSCNLVVFSYDLIHDPPGCGTLHQWGHVDFYPNGGQFQPTCGWSVARGQSWCKNSWAKVALVGILSAFAKCMYCMLYASVVNIFSCFQLSGNAVTSVNCNHGRSHDFFLDFINAEGDENVPEVYSSWQCKDYDHFNTGYIYEKSINQSFIFITNQSIWWNWIFYTS